MALHPDLIDRDEAALVVIDIQERLAAVMERRAGVVAAAARLVRLAELVGWPVVVTRQYPAGLGDTVAELTGVLSAAAAAVVDKTAFCACLEPAFLDAVDATGRSQFVVVGMETHICVTQTALAMSARGARVQVVDDACCSRADGDHDGALARLRSAGVTVTRSESVMYEAVARAGTDEFRSLLAIVKQG